MKFYKSRGQHILKNKKIVKRVVNSAEIKKSDVVLEVGCGTGVLTEYLLKRSCKVYGIEVDTRLTNILREKFKEEISLGKFILIEGDALKVDFPEFTKFVSNIPYSISSPITFKLLSCNYEKAVVMYQKEFAERLVSCKGRNYGRISVIVRALATPKLLFYVSRKNFYPEPKVDSAVVSFIHTPEIKVENFEIFEKFVTLCFTMRRKKMSKAFKIWKAKYGEYCSFPEELNKYSDLRAEDLTPEDFAKISNMLSEL